MTVLVVLAACDTEDEPPAGPCPSGSLEVGFEVESATLDNLPEAENPTDTFDLPCRVASVANGSSVLELACDEGGSEVTWTVSVQGPASLQFPLAAGDDVELRYTWERAFEVGTTRELQLRVADQAVLYAYASNLDGGLVGLCGPGEENGEDAVEAFLAPLGLGVQRGTCEPVEALRLDFDLAGEAASIYAGEQAEIGASGWSAAAGTATCRSQEDDAEGLGTDLWDISVVAWRPVF